MKYRFLGERSGLRVSELALGTGRLGTAKGRDADPAEAQRVFGAFADAGGNFIDTSSAYQGGRAEEMLGAFMATAGRDRFVVSSKYGRTPVAAPPPAAMGNHRKALQAEVEGSLRRLRTDRIDLYFPHFDDGITPVDEIMRGLDDLVRAGKILFIGLSNFPAWRIASAAAVADACGSAPVAVLQMQYNLLERSADREHLPLATARGLATMAWGPMAGGMLSGLGTRTAPAPSGTALRATTAGEGAEPDGTRAEAVRAAIAEVAAELQTDPATVAIAWVGAKGLFPVIGPRNPVQLGANLAAATLQFDGTQIERLDHASAVPIGHPYDLLRETRALNGIDGPRVGTVL